MPIISVGSAFRAMVGGNARERRSCHASLGQAGTQRVMSRFDLELLLGSVRFRIERPVEASLGEVRLQGMPCLGAVDLDQPHAAAPAAPA